MLELRPQNPHRQRYQGPNPSPMFRSSSGTSRVRCGDLAVHHGACRHKRSTGNCDGRGLGGLNYDGSVGVKVGRPTGVGWGGVTSQCILIAGESHEHETQTTSHRSQGVGSGEYHHRNVSTPGRFQGTAQCCCCKLFAHLLCLNHFASQARSKMASRTVGGRSTTHGMRSTVVPTPTLIASKPLRVARACPAVAYNSLSDIGTFQAYTSLIGQRLKGRPCRTTVHHDEC